jgi:hypothetical protein
VRLEHSRNVAVRQTLLLSEIRESLSVVPGQSFCGAKPHKTSRIADDAIDRVVSQTLLGREDSEVRMLRRSTSRAQNNNQKEPENGTAEFSAEGHRLFHLKMNLGQFRYSILHKYRERIIKLFTIPTDACRTEPWPLSDFVLESDLVTGLRAVLDLKNRFEFEHCVPQRIGGARFIE